MWRTTGFVSGKGGIDSLPPDKPTCIWTTDAFAGKMIYRYLIDYQLLPPVKSRFAAAKVTPGSETVCCQKGGLSRTGDMAELGKTG